MHLGQVGHPSPEPVKPNQAASHHDDDVHDQRDDRPASQRVRPTDDPEHRGQRSAAPSRFGLGGQLLHDVHRKPFHAARPAATSQANKTTTGQPRSCPFAAARSPSPSAAVGSAPISGCSTAGIAIKRNDECSADEQDHVDQIGKAQCRLGSKPTREQQREAHERRRGQDHQDHRQQR